MRRALRWGFGRAATALWQRFGGELAGPRLGFGSESADVGRLPRNFGRLQRIPATSGVGERPIARRRRGWCETRFGNRDAPNTHGGGAIRRGTPYSRFRHIYAQAQVVRVDSALRAVTFALSRHDAYHSTPAETKSASFAPNCPVGRTSDFRGRT